PAVGKRSDLVDGRDAGVLELARDAGLGQEALSGWGVVPVVVGEQLDGHVPAQGDVAGAVDDAHAAAADLIQKLVAWGVGRGTGRSVGSVPTRPGGTCQVIAQVIVLRATAVEPCGGVLGLLFATLGPAAERVIMPTGAGSTSPCRLSVTSRRDALNSRPAPASS